VLPSQIQQLHTKGSVMRRSQAKLLANVVKIKGSRAALALPAKRATGGEDVPTAKRLKADKSPQPVPAKKDEEEEEDGLAGLLGNHNALRSGCANPQQLQVCRV